nr:MAG TPA: hypothetical protein [Caudoviricetes sp.]
MPVREKERNVPRMGNAVSSRWFMRPCVHFCLRGQQVFSAVPHCAVALMSFYHASQSVGSPET